ncbi:MAG: CHAT domain-containing protein, partial [Bacteroidota bacterium]
RGFILAGVPSTLTTLWSVDDCSTSNLMQQFYQYLQSGMSKPKALRQAKLDHLEQASIVDTHPYYWAAFIQSGNPIALRPQHHIGWWLGAFAIILLVAGILWKRMPFLNK